MASSKLSYLYSDTHSDELSDGIFNLWSDKELYDYTLEAEGESVQVHRLVMAACSPYFRAMFCGQMKESKERRVDLKGITAETLRSLVNFAYSGELELCMVNIEELVAATRYFQMSEAEILCYEFLEMRLTKENFVEILNLSERCNLQRVQNNTKDFIRKEFIYLPEELLLQLSGQQLSSLIGSNSLCVNSEFQLFEKLMLWIKENPDASKEIVFDLLSKVRFPLMSGEKLVIAAETEQMTSSPRCKNLLFEALDYHKDILRQPMLQSERTQPRNATKSFILAANDSIYCMNQEKLFYENCELKRIQPLDSPNHVTLENMVVVDSYLYACHSLWCDNRCKYFHRYDPRFDEWIQLPTLAMQRDYLVLLPYKQSVFAIGMVEEEDGYEGFVEIFSIEQNKWMTGASVKPIGSQFAGVVCQENIYVSGGQDWSGSAVRDFNCYTPSAWESKTPMKYRHSYHEMAEFKGVIYVFGGNSECSVESYQPNADQWTAVSRTFSFELLGVVVNEDIYLLRHHEAGDEINVPVAEQIKLDLIYFEKYIPLTTYTYKSFYKYLKMDKRYKIKCAGLPLTFRPQREC